MCTLCCPWEALVIGCVGALLCCISDQLMFKLKVDDPVRVVAIHGVCAIWGLLSIGKLNYIRITWILMAK